MSNQSKFFTKLPVYMDDTDQNLVEVEAVDNLFKSKVQDFDNKLSLINKRK